MFIQNFRLDYLISDEVEKDPAQCSGLKDRDKLDIIMLSLFLADASFDLVRIGI